MDTYAYLAWPHMGVHGRMEDYSGYDPFWIVAHAAPLWIEALEEHHILPSVHDFYRQTLSNPDMVFGFVPDAEMIASMEAIVPYVIEKNGFYEIYDVIQDHRCHEDFASRPSWDKTNFYIRWYHMDT